MSPTTQTKPHTYGLPVPDPTPSYWQLPPHPLANHRTTSSLPTTDETQDIIILGSGITGAATAFKLLHPSHPNSSHNPGIPNADANAKTKILMLEARTAASGASGRNGGHCRAGWWTQFRKHVETFGEAEALKFAELEEGNVRDIAAFVQEFDVECGFREVESAELFATETGFAEAKEVVEFREEASRRHKVCLCERKVWSGREAREHMGMDAIVGGMTYPAYTLNPYQLVCRMLELSLARGLNLQTNTPALSVTRSADDSDLWDVVTERGVVRGRHVILATNGYTNLLHPSLTATGFLTPARSQVTALRTRATTADHPARNQSAGIDDFEKGGYFHFRPTDAIGDPGPLIYGGGRSVSKTREMNTVDDSTVHEGIAAYLHEAPRRLFGTESWGGGDKDDDEVLMDWTGVTCYTPDTFPLVGQAPGERGLWMSAGMSGHGSKFSHRLTASLPVCDW